MNTKRGIISTIVLIIVALIILGYYNISLKSIIESPIIRGNLDFAWTLISDSIKSLWAIILKALADVQSVTK